MTASPPASSSPTQPSAGFEVVERFTCGKNGEPDGREDAVVVTDHHAFVLDGVGSYPSFSVAGSTPGRLAAETVSEVLRGLPADATLRQTVDRATGALQTLLGDLAGQLSDEGHDLGRLPRPPAVQLTGYSPHLRQAWRVGDTSVRIGDEVHLRDQRFDLLCDGMRTMLRHAQALEQAASVHEGGGQLEPDPALLPDEDPMVALLGPLVEAQSQLLNRDSDSPYAFGWVTSRPCPDRFLEVWSVPRGADVVLATDGYPYVPAALELAEHLLGEHLARQPFSDLAREIDRNSAAEGSVSYDDRAWVRLRTT